MRALMHFIDEMPAAAVRVPTFNLAFLPQLPEDERGGLRRVRGGKAAAQGIHAGHGADGFPQSEMDAALARLRRTYERMDAEIEKSGGPWLLGKDITLADVAVMPALVRMDDLGLPRLAGPAARRHLVRQYPRAPGVQADLLSRLAADRALPAFAGEDRGADADLIALTA